MLECLANCFLRILRSNFTGFHQLHYLMLIADSAFECVILGKVTRSVTQSVGWLVCWFWRFKHRFCPLPNHTQLCQFPALYMMH